MSVSATTITLIGCFASLSCGSSGFAGSAFLAASAPVWASLDCFSSLALGGPSGKAVSAGPLMRAASV